MKKLVFSLLSTLLIIFSVSNVVLAHEDHDSDLIVPLYLNGKALEAVVPAQILNNTTMVPVRTISEQLGAKVEWNEKLQLVTVTKGKLQMRLTISNPDAVVNGKKIPLANAPLIIDGTTLLPLRFVSEQLGLKVLWNEQTRSVNLLQEIIPVKVASVNPVVITVPTPVPTTVPAATSTAKDTPATVTTVTYSTYGVTSIGEGEKAKKVLSEILSISSTDETIVVKASGALTPSVTFVGSPARLVLDLPNHTLNKSLVGQGTTYNGEIATTNPNISKIRYAQYQDNPAIVRIVIDLNNKVEYNLVENKVANEIVLSVKWSPFKVVIDAGHGGKDPGAKSIAGRYEKNFNLAVSLKINNLLKKETLIRPYMTRVDDTFVELNDRVLYANDLKADLFVSIHGNSFQPISHGTETYYYNENSLSLANVLHKLVVKATGFADKNVRKNNFRVVTSTDMPAVLLEIGYLSYKSEEAKMFTEDLQNRVASEIVLGIKQYLQVN